MQLVDYERESFLTPSATNLKTIPSTMKSLMFTAETSPALRPVAKALQKRQSFYDQVIPALRVSEELLILVLDWSERSLPRPVKKALDL